MYFTIRRNGSRRYRWRAVGDNDEVMAHSKLMSSKASCQSAIDTIKAEAARAPVYDKTDEVSVR